MKEALIQLKEVHHEEDNENNTNGSFFNGIEELPKVEEDDDGDIDDFGGFSETQSQYGGYEEEINEEDQRIMEAFLSKGQDQQKSLADIVIKKIKEKDVSVASDIRPEPKMDKSRIDIYKGVGIHLSKYTAGKIPKPFKCIPSLQDWEQVLYITEPENWSPNAMFQATRIFASNFSVEKIARFYKLFLLPRVREDIRKNKRLHFALYRSLKKALYKPGAFFKGIVFPLCESRTCTVREAHIIRSIIEKVSIPTPYSSAALVMLDGMEYWGIISFFIKLLVEKKYALPFSAVDAVVAHFMRFLNDSSSLIL
ncbi:hypothetical protein RIF29_19893 [Crotalaria pallida]|uniref:Bystin n=1 Tax=Crotalaria pallida TaxID=3830 RepID=A0AAN9F8L9_CROPI